MEGAWANIQAKPKAAKRPSRVVNEKPAATKPKGNAVKHF